MDRIYSRNRIRIPNFKSYNSNNKKIKKTTTILIILIIAIFTFHTIFNGLTPIFEGLCVERITSIATEIMNTEVNKVLLLYDYKSLILSGKDGESNNNILTVDVVTINKITSDLPIAIDARFRDIAGEKIGIPIGALTGSKYLAGKGPSVNIEIIQTGNVLTDVKTEFESKGINQTVYRIFLELKCVVSILTPYNTINKEVTNQVLLVETVVVGEVPQTYLNMDELIKDTN